MNSECSIWWVLIFSVNFAPGYPRRYPGTCHFYTLRNDLQAMKVVEYKYSLQWVGEMQCAECNTCTPAWRSSGMSDCAPHFYCDTCSNVIHRMDDKKLTYDEKSQAILDQISKTLPECPCGGRFAPDTDPKCPSCSEPMRHSLTPVDRLHDPNMIVLDGSCVFTDHGEPYRVKIVGYSATRAFIRKLFKRMCGITNG